MIHSVLTNLLLWANSVLNESKHQLNEHKERLITLGFGNITLGGGRAPCTHLGCSDGCGGGSADPREVWVLGDSALLLMTPALCPHLPHPKIVPVIMNGPALTQGLSGPGYHVHTCVPWPSLERKKYLCFQLWKVGGHFCFNEATGPELSAKSMALKAPGGVMVGCPEPGVLHLRFCLIALGL